MDFDEKIELLRYCVDAEGDGGVSALDWQSREELENFLDDIGERWAMFEEGK